MACVRGCAFPFFVAFWDKTGSRTVQVSFFLPFTCPAASHPTPPFSCPQWPSCVWLVTMSICGMVRTLGFCMAFSVPSQTVFISMSLLFSCDLGLLAVLPILGQDRTDRRWLSGQTDRQDRQTWLVVDLQQHFSSLPSATFTPHCMAFCALP